MSELLKRIENELYAARSMQARGVLLVRKGIYLARVGRFAETRAAIVEINDAFPIEEFPGIKILRMLVEGVLDYYESLSEHSHDRILRADLLGIASGDATLISMTSVWRAHIEFERSNYREMRNAIARVQSNADQSDHDAHARLARILADCFAIIGNEQQAKRWFNVAHRHAVDAGDQATIDALIYNRMAFGLARIRAESIFAPIDPIRLQFIETSLFSAKNYQSLVDIKSLTHLPDICEARLAALRQDFALALQLMSAVRDSGPLARNNFSEGVLNLEIVFLLAKSGDLEGARKAWVGVEEGDLGGLDIDDRLLAAWMHQELVNIDEFFGSLPVVEARLLQTREEYKMAMIHLSSMLHEFQGH
jgi:hypothetical protein